MELHRTRGLPGVEELVWGTIDETQKGREGQEMYCSLIKNCQGAELHESFTINHTALTLGTSQGTRSRAWDVEERST